MHKCFLSSRFLELFFFVFVKILGINEVIIMSIPICLCGFESLYIDISLFFLVVMFNISVRDDVVFSHGWQIDLFTSYNFRRIRRRSLVWSLEVMLSHIDVTYYVEIHQCVLAWPEVPRLLLRIIGPAFKTHHLVLKIHNVVCLFISKCSIL